MRYRAIQEFDRRYPIRLMCRALACPQPGITPGGIGRRVAGPCRTGRCCCCLFSSPVFSPHRDYFRLPTVTAKKAESRVPVVPIWAIWSWMVLVTFCERRGLMTRGQTCR